MALGEQARDWGLQIWHTAHIDMASLDAHAGVPDVVVHCAGGNSVALSFQNLTPISEIPLRAPPRLSNSCADVLRWRISSSYRAPPYTAKWNSARFPRTPGFVPSLPMACTSSRPRTCAGPTLVISASEPSSSAFSPSTVPAFANNCCGTRADCALRVGDLQWHGQRSAGLASRREGRGEAPGCGRGSRLHRMSGRQMVGTAWADGFAGLSPRWRRGLGRKRHAALHGCATQWRPAVLCRRFNDSEVVGLATSNRVAQRHESVCGMVRGRSPALSAAERLVSATASAARRPHPPRIARARQARYMLRGVRPERGSRAADGALRSHASSCVRQCR